MSCAKGVVQTEMRHPKWMSRNKSGLSSIQTIEVTNKDRLPEKTRTIFLDADAPQMYTFMLNNDTPEEHWCSGSREADEGVRVRLQSRQCRSPGRLAG